MTVTEIDVTRVGDYKAAKKRPQIFGITTEERLP